MKSFYKVKCLANYIEVFIPVPCDVNNPEFITQYGKAKYNSAKESI